MFPSNSARRRVLPALALLVLALALALVTGAFGGASSGSSSHSPRQGRHPSITVAGGGAVTSPRCSPSTLNRPAVLAGTPLSVSPLPGTRVAEPAAQISLLGAPTDQISAVRV